MLSKIKLFLIICGFVFFGTTTTVISKILYQTNVNGHEFRKPLFQNIAMFFGMSLSLIVYEIRKYISLNNNNNNNSIDELNDNNDIKPLIDPSNELDYGSINDNTNNKDEMLSNTKYIYLKLLIPAFCDFVATQLLNVALLWITASIWQMVRGSIILWTALFRTIWLKKKLKLFELFSVFLVIIALIIIGCASILSPSHTGTEENSILLKCIGVILVVLSQAIQATQTVIEEKFLQDLNVDELVIVGMEGIWGFLLSVCIALPISKYVPGDEGNGIHEDTVDTFDMIGKSSLILILVIIYTFAILFFNLFGLLITKHVHSVTRNIMDSVRTMSIWIVVLFIHYKIDHNIGEAWTNYSFMELGGFIILIIGILSHREVFRIPFLPSHWFE